MIVSITVEWQWHLAGMLKKFVKKKKITKTHRCENKKNTGNSANNAITSGSVFT